MNQKRVLLLIGSPRTAGNSESLGDGLGDNLKNLGWTVEKIRIPGPLRSPAEMDSLTSKMLDSGLFILSSPLYADGVPAMVLRAFEEIKRAKEALPPERDLKGVRMTAIFNCGFPESHHNDVALKICRLFAADVGFHWVGGLGLGMGEVLGRRPLAEAGRVARPVGRALALAAEALDQGKDIPPEAVELMAKPLIPRFLYVLMGNRGWKKQAEKNDLTAEDLYRRPFLEE